MNNSTGSLPALTELLQSNIKKLFFLLLFIITSFSQAQTSMSESAVPSIDGKIDEAEWRGAKVIKDFYMISPRND